MSTNDTALLLASGASGVVPSQEEFTAALGGFARTCLRQLIADAEALNHEIAIEVVGAATATPRWWGVEAARSNLFNKIFGAVDPNWGRVLSAVGVTDAAFDADQLDVSSSNGVQACRCRGGIGEPRTWSTCPGGRSMS